MTDFIIRANENIHNAEENRKLQYMAELRAFVNVSRSTFFMAELLRKHPKANSTNLTLGGDNSSIDIKLWFAILHCEDVSKLPEHLLVREVWNVVGVGAKFDICY